MFNITIIKNWNLKKVRKNEFIGKGEERGRKKIGMSLMTLLTLLEKKSNHDCKYLCYMYAYNLIWIFWICVFITVNQKQKVIQKSNQIHKEKKNWKKGYYI